MLSRQQMQAYDYDWFCIINGKPVCVASNGDIIPNAVNFDDNVIRTQSAAYRLPQSYRFTLNREYILNNVVNTGYEYLADEHSPYRKLFRPRDIEYPADLPLAIQYYGEHFAKMAKRGFYVFDRLQDTPNSYFLSAWPDRYDMARLNERVYHNNTELSFTLRLLDFDCPETLVDLDLVTMFMNTSALRG